MDESAMTKSAQGTCPQSCELSSYQGATSSILYGWRVPGGSAQAGRDGPSGQD